MKAPHGIQGCLRFSRHGGIYRSDGRFKTLPEFPRGSASCWSGASRAEGRGFHPARHISSSAMSSSKLFLDQVARQQEPVSASPAVPW